MRCLLSTLLIFSTSTLVHAQEPAKLCDGNSLTDCIEMTAHNPKIATGDFMVQQEFDLDLIDTRAITRAPWFKKMVIVYWIGAAVNSFLDDDEFRFKSNMLRERTISASYEFGKYDSRMILDPRRSLIYFPLRGKKKTHHLWAIHVASRGAVITFAINLDGANRRRI